MFVDWLSYFRHNREDRHLIPWERCITVAPRLHDPLIRSLQRFQVGEQGDGKHLKQGAATLGDPDYEETIRLFIEEEQEHSRLLARILNALDAPLLAGHWSDRIFIVLRRMTGLNVIAWSGTPPGTGPGGLGSDDRPDVASAH